MKPTHKLNRRSFMGRVVGTVAIGGALSLVGGEALAFQVSDSDSGPNSGPVGRRSAWLLWQVTVIPIAAPIPIRPDAGAAADGAA